MKKLRTLGVLGLLSAATPHPGVKINYQSIGSGAGLPYLDAGQR